MSSFSRSIQGRKGAAHSKTDKPSTLSIAPHHSLTGQRGFSPPASLSSDYSPLVVQPKLIVGPPGDKYEQEADRVADRIMRMPEPGGIRQEVTEEEELVQPKRIASRDGSLTDALPTGLEAVRSGGQPLPAEARAFFEPRFGYSFESVRVHTGAAAEDAAARIGARAFTLDSSVAFGRGEYGPDTAAGKTLLAHELTHVVQQAGGRQRIQRQVQIDPFVASATPTVGLDPDMTTAFLAGLGPGGLRVNAGVTRFSFNGTPYTSADTIAQDLNLPLLSERDLRTIPKPNLRDPKLARVWSDNALVKKGQEATAVRLVQQALQAWGRGKVVPKDPLPIFGADAIFGDETFTAVRMAQTEWAGAGAPLKSDGLVGPLTLGALEAAMADLNVSEFWLNTAPNNQITGTIHHILPPALWSTIPMMRSTLEARARAAGFHTRSFAPCRRRNNRLTFSAQGPANLDQLVLAHEQIHEADIGTSVRKHILPWYGAVTQLIASGQRFRAANLAAAEALIYAEIGRRTAPTGGDPCSVGGALEVELVNLEFALHRRPRSGPRFTGFTTNAPRCNHADANLDHQGGGLPRQVPVVACNPSPHMTISVQVPV